MNTIEMIIMWLKTVYRIWKILLLNIQSCSIEGVLTRFWTFIYFKWQTHNILMELWHLFKKQVSVVTAELPHTCTIYFITDNLLILDYILLKTVWLYYNTNLIHSVHWSLVIDLTLKVKKKKRNCNDNIPWSLLHLQSLIWHWRSQKKIKEGNCSDNIPFIPWMGHRPKKWVYW